MHPVLLINKYKYTLIMSSRLSTASHADLLVTVSRIIPPLLESFHKGQAGRIAVVGGCEEYVDFE